MGYVQHHAIIVTGWSEQHVNDAHAAAVTMFPPNNVSSILVSQTNCYLTFCVAPDGSKEGWAESAAGDERRAAFLRGLVMHDGYLEWCEVAYGNDPHAATVTASAWEPSAVDA